MRGDTLKSVQPPSSYLARRRQSTKGRRPGVQHRRLLCEELEDRRLLSINVVLIGDAVAQAQQLRAAAAKETVAIIYDSDTMTTTGLADLLVSVSAAHNGAPIGHLGIVAHGAPGELDLGKGDDLSLATLPTQAAALERLRSVLTSDARLDLYSCSVAAGAGGKTFVDELAAVTGAAVFASDNPVGTLPGADFIWEYHTGHAVASVELFATAEMETIQGLSLPTVPLFSQQNLAWAPDHVIDNWGDTGETIQSIGCAMTCTAMLAKYYGKATSDPKQLNAWLNTHAGYVVGSNLSRGNLVWSKPAEYSDGGMTYMPNSAWTSQPPYNDNDHWSDLKAQLDQGYPVIVLVDGRPLTPALDNHWVLVTGFLGGSTTDSRNYAINDPWDGTTSTLHRYYDATYDNTFFAIRVYHGVAVTRLLAPTLNNPSDGATNVSTTTGFSWSQVSGNHGYRIIVSANSADMTDDPESQGVTPAAPGFNAAPATDQNTYTPTSALSAGTKYYWEVHARAGSLDQAGYWSQGTFTTASDTTQTYALTTGLNGLSFPFTPKAAGSSLFSDVLGSIQQATLKYVFYMDNNGDFQVSSYSGMAAAAKTGYLLWLNEPASFTASGDAVDTGITLHSGWNYVGVTRATTPAQNPQVYPNAYALQGGTLQPRSIFQQGMSPGVAYFIYSFADANVLIPNGAGASMALAGSPLDSEPGEGSVCAMPAASGTIGDNFQASLTTSQEGSNDVVLTLGVQPGATDGYDAAFDQLAPPSLPGSSAAYFNEQQRLWASYKAAGDVKEWPLTVVSQTAFPEVPPNTNPVTLSWTIPSSGSVDPSAQFQLLDGNRNVLVADMRTQTTYSFPVTAAGTQKSFIIRATLAVQGLVLSTTTLAVNEGASNTFTVKLAAQPTSDVTVTVSRTAGDTDLSVTGGATLTFTSVNWNTAQTVTVSAAEDADTVNGTATITVASAGLTSQTVTANEVDNDVQNLVVSTTTLPVNEGSSNTFTVKLAAQPTGDVTVTAARTAGDTDLSVTGGATLTFTSVNWNAAQTVTVSAAEDADTVNGTATITVASAGLTSQTVTANEVDNDVQNQPPSASVTTPPSPQSGNVTITYTLTDPESDTCSIQVQYSKDGFNTYELAHAAGGDGTTGLASSPSGTSHMFLWDSHYNIGDTNVSTAQIRITPSDAGGAGTAGTTAAFTVNNTGAPANDSFANRTSISGTSITLPGTNVGASKESGEPNHAGLGGGKSVWWTWTAPSSGNAQIDTIGSNFDTILGVYTGNSVSALTTVASDDDSGGNLTSKVTFNAVSGTAYQIAVDGWGGASGTITLHVTANQRPSVPSITTPTSPQSGNVTISYSLADAESDMCAIAVQYSPDGGSNWNTATAGPGGDGTIPLSSSPGGTSHTFVWASGSDIVNANNTNVKFCVIPVDAGGGGTAGTTGTFTVNNYVNPPPSIGSLSASPDPVMQGNTLTLTANNVTDSDGTVVKAEFYRDANGNGSIEVGTDVLLGTATTGSAGVWTWTGPTSGFPLGTNTYMARAQDDGSAWSTTVTTTGTVNPNSFTGTAEDDTFKFTAGGTWHEVVVTLSGGAPKTYRYPAFENTNVTFDGLGGNDSVTFNGASGDETANLYPDHGTFTGAGYSVWVSNVEQITVTSGGGSDVARLYDSSADDTFAAWPDRAVLSGAGFSNRADGFRFVFGYAANGNDAAELYDSAGNDIFDGRKDYGVLYGTGFYNRANGFEAVVAHSVAGGVDIARLYESAGDDTLAASPAEATLSGAGFSNRAQGFRYVMATASTGHDTAALTGSLETDTFQATPTFSALSAASYYVRTASFDSVSAQGTAGGADVARLYDSAGNDTLVAYPADVTLSGPGFSNQAKTFRYVLSYATAGGTDTAQLYDSAANDTFSAYPSYAALYGADFYNRASYFDSVVGHSTAGSDLANLYDSPAGDTLEARPQYAVLSGPGFSNRANTFRYLSAYSSAGNDVAELYDSAGNDVFTFSVNRSGRFNGTMSGGTYANRANDFPAIRAHASAGYDEARLFDSVLNELLEAGGALGSDTAKMSNVDLDFAVWVSTFDKVTAVSSNAGDKKHVVPPLDFTLITQGPWEDV